MPTDVEYEYVWATIDTAKEKLFVYHDSKLVVEYPGSISKVHYVCVFYYH